MATQKALVEMMPIHLGDLILECPLCNEVVDKIHVGLGTQEVEGADFMELHTFGLVMYACGDVCASECLADKVGKIINGYEKDMIPVALLAKLDECEEHGPFKSQKDDDAYNEEEQ